MWWLVQGLSCWPAQVRSRASQDAGRSGGFGQSRAGLDDAIGPSRPGKVAVPRLV